MESQITEIKAYKVNGLLFETLDKAERYVYEKLSQVNIGDTVSLDGGFKSVFGTFGLEGKVFDIDGDQIWFVKNLPIEYENHPKEFIKCGAIYINGKFKEWEVMCRNRSKLSKKMLPFIKSF